MATCFCTGACRDGRGCSVIGVRTTNDVLAAAAVLERIGAAGPAAQAPTRIRERIQRKRDHGGESIACAYCNGQGDICHPGNADPSVKVTEWLYPPPCPRCGGTGKDPNP